MLSFKKVILVFSLSAGVAFADGEHYKNTLIGGRASSLGGAYTALSDDSAGSIYNPAGLSYAASDSISGSANVYQISNFTYEKSIENKDWERDNESLKPNYFGLVKKNKKFTYSLSYILTDSFEENQNQVYENLTDLTSPIDVYSLNLHSKDSTFLLGGAGAYKIADNLSLGLGVFYHYRVLRRTQGQHIEFSDSTDESTFLDVLKKEKGVRTSIGVMYSPKEKISLGLQLAKTELITAITKTEQFEKDTGSSNGLFLSKSDDAKRKLPIEASFGFAYFPSSYKIFSLNLDYFYATDDLKDDTINASLGMEHFFNETHALRAGLYTNRSNSKKLTNSTRAPGEHIDLYGVTLGHGFFMKGSSISSTIVYARGSGDAQIYENSSVITKLKRSDLSFVIASDYEF